MQQSQFNLSIPAPMYEGGKVMCKCFIRLYVCTLSHVHADPYSEVPRDINHEPCASCCLQRDRFVPLIFSQRHDTLHMNASSYVCVSVSVCSSYGIRFNSSKLLMWVLPAATEAKAQEVWEVGEQVIMWRECQLTWLQRTHINVGKGQKWISPICPPPHCLPEASLQILQAQFFLNKTVLNLEQFTTGPIYTCHFKCLVCRSRFKTLSPIYIRLRWTDANQWCSYTGVKTMDAFTPHIKRIGEERTLLFKST